MEVPEFDGTLTIWVETEEPSKLSRFYWHGATGQKLLAEPKLTENENAKTIIEASEGKMDNNEAGIA